MKSILLKSVAGALAFSLALPVAALAEDFDLRAAVHLPHRPFL